MKEALQVSRQHGHYHFCIELFSGKGGISAGIRSGGFGVVSVEILNGIHACAAPVVKFLLGWISNGVVAGMWLGTLCSSWSRALRDINGLGPRTAQHIWGVPGLGPAELERLRLGNATMRVFAWLIRASACIGLPTVLENPSASYLRQAPPLA